MYTAELDHAATPLQVPELDEPDEVPLGAVLLLLLLDAAAPPAHALTVEKVCGHWGHRR